MKLPSNLKKITLFLERLPGIGEKTAARLAFYLLRLPESDLKEFGESLRNVKSTTKMCRECYNLTENEICSICEDRNRNIEVISVVEEVLDLMSFETGNIYKGVYHVLHGRIDPLNNIRPEDIYIEPFLKKIKENGHQIKEIILATNPDMEGEATAMYIRDRLKEINQKNKYEIKITRLAYGLPIGANLEYTDYLTLRKSIENRKSY